MRFPDLATPVALVDGFILERNVGAASRFAQQHGIALRPHVKTHKCAEIARMQLSAGAAGITCATVDEAKAFAEAGIRDIFVAYPIVGESKIALLKNLCDIAKVIVAVDHEDHITQLTSAAFDARLSVRIEIDSGHHRCGLPPGSGVVRLAQKIAAAPALILDGVFTHAGHVYAATTPGERRLISETEGRSVADAAMMIRDAGIPCPNVSVGSTPTWRISGTVPGVTEARPGNYVYNDAIQVGLGVAAPEDCAFTVLATVVDVYDDRFVIDAGSKAMGLDKGAHGLELLKGYGIIHASDGTIVREWVLSRLSEEHGIVPLEPSFPKPVIGDRLSIVPNHSCAAANLYSRIHYIDPNGVVQPYHVIGRHD